jgi:hypothetical protein
MVSSSLIDRSYRTDGPGPSVGPARDALYEAFGHLGVPDSVVHCPHCVSTPELEELCGTVAAISPATASRFVRKVGTTWGGADDLHRATPRLLELAADHRLQVSRSLLWQKLRWAGWTEWPAPERDAVGRFLLAEFARLLGNAPRPAHVAHRWLAQVSAGVDDISGFLTLWHDAIGPLPDPEVAHLAAAHLVELLTSSPLRPDLPSTVRDVLPGNRTAAEQLRDFLTGPGTDVDLRRVAAELEGTRSSRRVTVAVERLRRYRTAVGRTSELRSGITAR